LALAIGAVGRPQGPAAQNRAAEWTDILPPADLHGWTRIPIPPVDGLKPKLQWRVDADRHVLICSGDGGHEWLRYDQELGDFIFQVDWRFTPRGPDERRYNSGVGIRLSKYGEIWYQAKPVSGAAICLATTSPAEPSAAST